MLESSVGLKSDRDRRGAELAVSGSKHSATWQSLGIWGVMFAPHGPWRLRRERERERERERAREIQMKKDCNVKGRYCINRVAWW